MAEWWSSLDLALKILYCIAVPTTVILVIQTVLLLIGFGDGGAGIDGSDISGLDLDVDVDADVPADLPDDVDFLDGGNPADFATMRLFTLQTVIAFLTVFSWSSIVSLHTGSRLWLALLIGGILGAIAMVLLAKLVQLSAKLAENGTHDLRYALGSTATVYLPIPAGGSGYGKVTFTLQGTFTEQEAITLGEALPVGTTVRIIDIRDDVLVVDKED